MPMAKKTKVLILILVILVIILLFVGIRFRRQRSITEAPSGEVPAEGELGEIKALADELSELNSSASELDEGVDLSEVFGTEE